MEALKASLLAECHSEYLKTWFAPRALLEMLYYRRLISQYEYQDLLRVVLSRAVRSSRSGYALRSGYAERTASCRKRILVQETLADVHTD